MKPAPETPASPPPPVSALRQQAEARLAAQSLQASDARFHTLADLAPVGIYLTTPEGHCQYVNPRWCEMSGLSLAAALGDGWMNGLHPEDRPSVLSAWHQMVASEGHWGLEYRFLTPAGKVTWVWGLATPQRDALGKIVGYIGINSDITDRKLAEDATRRTQELFRVVFDASRDGILAEENETIVFCNLAFARLYGYGEPRELVGKHVSEVQSQADNERMLRFGQMRLHGEPAPSVYEFQARRKDGSLFAAENSVGKVEIFGKFWIVSVIRDVTERKQRETIMAARLRLLQFSFTHSLAELLQATLDEAEAITASQVGFYHMVESDQVTLSLQAWSTNTTQHLCQAQGAGLHYPVNQAGVWVDAIRERRPVIHNDYASLPHRKGLPEGHAPVTRELVVPVLRGGRIVAVLGVGNKLADYDDGDVAMVMSLADFAWDIAERKRTEEALTVERNLLRTLFNNLPDLVFTKDSDARIVQCNTAAAQFLGLSEAALTGKSVFDVNPADLASAYDADDLRVLRSGEIVYNREEQVRDHNGLLHWFLTTKAPVRDPGGRVVGLVAICRNIDERKRIEAALHQTEARFRAIATHTPDHILMQDRDLRYLFVINPQLGLTEADMIGKTEQDFLAPEDAAKLVAIKRKVLETGEAAELEMPLQNLKGETEYFEGAYIPIFDLAGQADGLIGYFRNVTARKQTEAVLARSRAELKTIYDHAPVMMCVVDAQRQVLYANPAFTAFTGALESDLLGGRACGVFGCLNSLEDPRGCGFGADCPQCALRLAIEDTFKTGVGHQNVEHLATLVRGTDRRAVALLAATALLRARAQPCLLLCLHDITARKRAEESLREMELRYRSLFDQANEGLLLMTLDGHLSEINQAFAAMHGYQVAELKHADIRSLDVLHDQAMADRADILRRLQAGEVVRFEVEHYHKDGHRFPLAVTTSMVSLGGQPFILAFHQDIAERKRAEEALRESEIQLSESQAIAGLGTYVLHFPTGQWKSSALLDQIFGIGATHDRSVEGWAALIHPEDRAMMVDYFNQEVLAQGQKFEREYRIIRQDNQSERWVYGLGRLEFDTQGHPLYLRGTVQDITGRKSLEGQLLQAQKLESIGQLAGGVAHDFNNILTATIMHLDSLQEHPSLDPETQETVTELMENAKRAANLTQQLLLFSRRSVMVMKVLDLNDLVANLLKLLGRLIGEHIKVRFDRSAGLPSVVADPGMLEQLLTNLAVNARDAMPKGGLLTISIVPVQVDAERLKGKPDVQPGPFVCLSVADTGCGMDEATLARIFEPFFTTKDVGRGTGLGLATVHGIVAQHKGWVEVASALGQGTTFKIFLPATAQGALAPAQAKPTPSLRGHETILFVEDETSVRVPAARNLQKLGYRVLQAAHGPAALELWQEHAGQIDLLFSDMVMPEGLTGLDLALKLWARKPSLKVIITSGYNLEMAGHAIPAAGGFAFLQKPYALHDLSQAIRACLDA
jgi:PAS domain S-box-containing protein